MECEPTLINASPFTDNVSTNAVSFAVNSSWSPRRKFQVCTDGPDYEVKSKRLETLFTTVQPGELPIFFAKTTCLRHILSHKFAILQSWQTNKDTYHASPRTLEISHHRLEAVPQATVATNLPTRLAESLGWRRARISNRL